MNAAKTGYILRALLLAAFLPLCASCASMTASAEEYYSIGMAYFEMGKYDEAERWLNRALSLKRTMSASEYNLGRIAYGTGRYTDALGKFNAILRKDPENVMALKAAAYTQVKLGNLTDARKLYDKVLTLEPEAADSGLNYATILYAMDEPKEAEEVLQKYDYTILDDKDALLLLARVQKAQEKPEAIDNYDLWLSKNSDAQVQYEFSIALENGGFYARALESARKTLEELSSDTETLKRSEVRFLIARLILISDPENEEGITELREAVRGGFENQEAMDALRDDERLPKAVRDEVGRTIDTARSGSEDSGTTSEEDTQNSSSGDSGNSGGDSTEGTS
jgi:tetratricopeptide (TPR) repeat protein